MCKYPSTRNCRFSRGHMEGMRSETHLHGQDQDTAAAAPLDQLGEKDAALDRLSEANGVGDQDALAGLLEMVLSSEGGDQ